jgi:hypothetical protein
MGCRYGTSDINGISIGISIRNMGHPCGIWYIDMVMYHINMVILDIDMGYGLMMWKMTVLIQSSPISIWDIMSDWQCTGTLARAKIAQRYSSFTSNETDTSPMAYSEYALNTHC